ncbi:unnamed protein product [Sphenostylis stenocarpa]|uniref:Uncharacterized protein n=1 Tax=Sphenostylis stenocarpa TaxID=92480 RepID=A0AA86SX33_9FABA|nr:unnamed protein product [Sphenostylis stenocarpa]
MLKYTYLHKFGIILAPIAPDYRDPYVPPLSESDIKDKFKKLPKTLESPNILEFLSSLQRDMLLESFFEEAKIRLILDQ